ncbi:MAG: restriction endonuclease subunit [Chthoniobacteraceae bacterium]|nr:restriction endonuclease subunit [Chthoniobacteraceae bacterium]
MNKLIPTKFGFLPEDWRIKSLAGCTTKIQDGTHFSPRTTEGPFLYVTSKNIRPGRLDLSTAGCISEEEHRSIYSRCDVKPGDVLLTKDGANTGNACLNTEDQQFSLLSSVAVLRADHAENVGGFILQYLMSPSGQKRLKDLMSGNAIPRLTLQKIKAFELPVPPRPQQCRIAEILSTVDEVIEQTEALIGKYQQIKVGLMHDLFTRGVTPDGQLRPTHAEAPHLYQTSPLGWIPKKWKIKPLLHFVPIAVYGISVSMDDDPSGVPVMRMNNIFQGRINVSDIKFSETSDARSLTLRYDDVLFNRTNSLEHVGKTAIWRGELPAASFASYLVRLDVDTQMMRPLFLVYWLNLPITQLIIRQFATPGVHQVNINPTNLRRINCAAPIDLSEQDRITSRIEALDVTRRSHDEHLAKLRQQKQGLMHDLLTGRVRVPIQESDRSSPPQS